MTAFIARNTTESITFLRNDADKDLTEWSVKLAKEYIERDGLVVKTSELPKGAGSDYMSWDAAGYRESAARVPREDCSWRRSKGHLRI